MDDTDHAFYPRFSDGLVATALKDTQVVMVTGPRQCGKTTLVPSSLGEFSRPHGDREPSAPRAG
jgi:predicted AAA+ superfamily ATPase